MLKDAVARLTKFAAEMSYVAEQDPHYGAEEGLRAGDIRLVLDALREQAEEIERLREALADDACPRCGVRGKAFNIAHIKACHESLLAQVERRAEKAEAELAAAIKQALEQHRIVQDLGRELRAEQKRVTELAKISEGWLQESHRHAERAERLEKAGMALANALSGIPVSWGGAHELRLWAEALRPAAPPAGTLRVRIVAGDGNEAQLEETADFTPAAPEPTPSEEKP